MTLCFKLDWIPGGHLVPDVLSCSYKKTRERVPFSNVSKGPRRPVFRGANSTIISKKVVFFCIGELEKLFDNNNPNLAF